MQNTDNLSIARGPTSVIKKPSILWLDRGFVKARKGKSSVSSICLDLMPSYSVKVVVKPNPAVYTIPHTHKLDYRRGNTSEQIVRFLNSMVPLPMIPTYA